MLHSATHCWLGDVKAFRSTTEVQVFGDGEKVVDQAGVGIDALHVSIDPKQVLCPFGDRATVPRWTDRLMSGAVTRRADTGHFGLAGCDGAGAAAEARRRREVRRPIC